MIRLTEVWLLMRWQTSQGFHNVLAAWLAATHRRIQVQIFGYLQVPLESPAVLMWYILRWIITRNKMWIHYDDLESKCQSMKCKHLLSKIKRKFKMQPIMRECPDWFSGFHRDQYWNIIMTGMQQSELLISVVCCVTVWSRKFWGKLCTNREEYIVNVFWPTHISRSAQMLC